MCDVCGVVNYGCSPPEEKPPVESLVIAYQEAKDSEEDRWLREHPLYHSPWNPRLTHSMNEARVERLRDHLKQWSVQWMLEQGYRVVFAKDGSDSFNVVAI